VTGRDPTRRAPAADAGRFLGTFALILAGMAGLFAVDTLLAGVDARERRSEAAGLYREGAELAAAGQHARAVDRLQGAVAAERGNPVYQRALASALLEAGRVTEAGRVLDDRLQHEPTDAAAALLTAHALERQGRLQDAVSYYHRAIYGHWDADSAAHRIRARFELVDLLAQLGAQQELLAELLPLQSAAPADVATRRRIARLFLEAGSPPRAIEIYRDLLRRDPRDAATWAGLGEAEFARGAYRSARAVFAAAARLAPADSAFRERLATTGRILALDPTQRGLAREEQRRRARALLGLTRAAADSCFAADPSRVGPQDSSRAVLADSIRMAVGADSTTVAADSTAPDQVERDLALAERLWDLRRRACAGALGPGEQVLGLVLDKVAQ
jgi:tetratricopeptide (TPR) repeat protein